MKSKEFISPTVENKTVEELTVQLLEAHAQLKAMQREREMMLANISHDLRAPITAIRSAVDLAMSTPDLSAQELRKTIALVDRRTATLQDLINDMYYLFCVEDSSRELELTSVEAAPFLEEYFYDAIVDSRYDSFDMNLDIPQSLNCRINIDVQKIIRVLDNLLTNAAKYAADGDSMSITLSARLDSSAGSTSKLVIRVIDTGRGIAPEALPHLFQRTYTVSDARTPGASGGSGLGLAIAKAILERHGGTIECASTLGVGTTFTIMLPAF